MLRNAYAMQARLDAYKSLSKIRAQLDKSGAIVRQGTPTAWCGAIGNGEQSYGLKKIGPTGNLALHVALLRNL